MLLKVTVFQKLYRIFLLNKVAPPCLIGAPSIQGHPAFLDSLILIDFGLQQACVHSELSVQTEQREVVKGRV